MSFTRNEQEEEYFARKEFERRQKVEAEKQKQMEETEKQRLKELHHMRCPKCGMPLLEIDYKSIKVDQCSNCRGIWLDNNEMESISKLHTAEASALGKLFSVFK
jgi:uncharacterized paraquat-inducible protein A